MQERKMKIFEKMQERANVLALSVVLILSLGLSQTALACPHPCACYVQTEVHCTFRSLAAVPTRIPKHVERINLGFNSIQSILESSFAGLSKLELLMIHGNEIHAIPDGAFRDLMSLQVFKMSYNKLKVITGQTFQGLTGVMRLHIDHNKIEFIHPNAFNGLTSLRLLHLEGNLLRQLHPYTFTTFGFLQYFRLSTIKHLYLSENVITNLPETMIQSMPLLESLFLHGNPWSCDCSLKWLPKWDEQSGGVLKCKKDRAYEGGQLCPMCSNPKHLNKKELQNLNDISCTKPIIYSPLKQNNSINNVEETETDQNSIEEFQTWLGNISLNMTDEHGNLVNMACKIKKSTDFKKIHLSQMLPEEIDVNATFSLDFECPMNRENYEKLWKLIAYYSEVPVKLQRGLMLNKDPKVSYRYKQDMDQDSYYYTGVKAHVLAEPEWLMQQFISIQLNRRQSTATKVTLSFFTQLYQSIQVKDVHYQRNNWVMIEQHEKPYGSQSTIQGTDCQLSCNVKASESPSIEWMFPDGTKLKAPYNNPNSRFSISISGQLLIKAAELSDSGLYHCIAQVRNDMDIMPFRVAVEPPAIEPSDTISMIERYAGEPVMLPCTVIAVPEAQQNWIFPSKKVLDGSSNTSRGYVLENGTLLIQNSQVSDSGYYRCIAVNQHGTDQYAVKVTVNKKDSEKSSNKLKSKTQPVTKISTKRTQSLIDNEGGSGDIETLDVSNKTVNQKDREVSIKQRNNRPSRPHGKNNKKDRRKMKAFNGLQGPQDTNVAEGRRVFESRRRINVGSKQIDPRHWADILAKVRGKNIAITTVSPSFYTTRMTTVPVLRHKFTTPSPIAKPPIPPTSWPIAELEESSADGPHLEEDELLYTSSSDTTAVADYKHEFTSFTEPTIKSPTTETMEESIEYEIVDSPEGISTAESETTTSVPPHLTSPDQDHGSMVTGYSDGAVGSITSITEDSQDDLNISNTPSVTVGLSTTVHNSFGEILNTGENQVPLHVAVLEDIEPSIGQNIEITSLQPSIMDGNDDDIQVAPFHVDDSIHFDFTVSTATSTVSPMHVKTTSSIDNSDMVIPLPQTPTDQTASMDNGVKAKENILTFGNGDTAAEPQAGTERENINRKSIAHYNRHSEIEERQMAPIPTTDSGINLASTHISFKEAAWITTAIPFRRLVTTTVSNVPYRKTTTSRLLTNGKNLNPRRRPNGKRRLRPNRFRQRPKTILPTSMAVPEPTSSQKTFVTVPEKDISTKTTHTPDIVANNKELQLEKDSYLKTTTLSTTDGNDLQLSAGDQIKVPISTASPTVLLAETQHVRNTTTVKPMQLSTTMPTTMLTTTIAGITKGKKIGTTEAHLTQHGEKSTLASYNYNAFVHASEDNVIQKKMDVTEDGTYTDSTIYPGYLPSMTTPSNPVPSLTTESPIQFQGDSLHVDSQRETHHTPAVESPPTPPTMTQHIVLASTASVSIVRSVVIKVQRPTTTSHKAKAGTIATDHQTTKTVTVPALFNPRGEQLIKQSETKPAVVTLFPKTKSTQVSSGEQTRSVTRRPDQVTQQIHARTESPSPAALTSLTPLAQPETHSPWTSPVTVGSSVNAPSTKDIKEYIGFNQVESPKTVKNAETGNHGNKLIPRQNEFATAFPHHNIIHTNLNQKQSKEISAGRLNNSLLLSPHFRRQPGITPSFNQWPVVVPPQYNQVRGTIKPSHVATHSPLRHVSNYIPLHHTNKPEITAFAKDKIQERKMHTPQPATTPFQVYRPNPILPGRFNNQGNSRTAINHRLFGNNYVTDGKSTAARIPYQGVPYYMNPRIPFMLNRTRTFNRLTTTSKPLIPFLPKPPTNVRDRYFATASTNNTAQSSVVKTTTTPASPVTRITSSHKRPPTTHLMTTTPSAVPQSMIPHTASTILIHRNNHHNIQQIPLVPQLSGPNENGSRVVQPSSTFKALRESPKITSRGYQSLAIPAEMDAVFPCETVGEPKPFLTWTKVSTGATMTANTRIQRFEVMKNGTFVIRKIQLQDRGQYLCTAQNQYGVDKMIITLTVVAQQPKLLVQRYRDATAYLGETVTMECLASGTPHPHISWIFPDRKVMRTASTTEGRIKLYENGTLSIGEATFSDRGIFKCIASNVAGTDSLTVRLHIAALPPIIQHEKEENISLSAGHSVYVHCLAKGAPVPSIRWVLFDGTQVRPSQFVNGNLFVFPNGTLYIRSISPRDSGNYDCIAANIVGAVRRTVNLNVKKLSSNAKITRSSPQKTDITYGSTLRLDCTADGDPGPRILWRLPSKKLVDSLYSFESRTRVYANGTLIVQSVTDKDAGDYLCVARNKIGDDYVVLKVNVMMKPAKIEHKNEVNHKIIYGGDLKVDCVATGLPNPEISWSLPDGSMVNNLMQSDDSGARTRRYVVFNNGTLFFNEVGMKEEGDYTCYAVNQIGKDEMRVSIKVVAEPATIRNKTYSIVNVPYGDVLAVACEAKGEPTPKITWLSPTNRPISAFSNKYQVYRDGTLFIQKAQRSDSGNYTCVARNNAGEDKKIVQIQVNVQTPNINGYMNAVTIVQETGMKDTRKLIDCKAEGIPAPRVLWAFPEGVILPAPYYGNRITVHRNGTLDIKFLRKTDSVQLVCIGRNEGGEARLIVQLTVTDPLQKPSFKNTQPENVAMAEGYALSLNCSAEGSPEPDLVWTLPNGTTLQSGHNLHRFYHRKNGTLHITRLSKGDAGAYRCTARNMVGYSEMMVSLKVGPKPEIKNPYNNLVSIINGETLELQCITQGELRPHISWTLPNGVLLDGPQAGGRFSILENGSLIVRDASVYDRGTYLCKVTTEYGSSIMNVPVIVIAYPPRITSGPAPVVYTRPGNAVQLNCMTIGIPKAVITWELPDKSHLTTASQSRLYGNKFLHPQGTLVIQHPSQRDVGFYKCTAKNILGSDSKTTYIHVF